MCCQLNRLEHNIAQMCQLSTKQTRAEHSTDILSIKQTIAELMEI